MSLIDTVTEKAGRLAGDMQMSLRRARVEGERRLLQRQHRSALEELGAKAYELVRAGALPEEPLSAEVAAVEAKLIEIEAKVTEIERMRSEDEREPEASPAHEDPSVVAFPMVGGAASEGDGEATERA